MLGCLLIHFVLKNVYVPFGNCKYYVLYFIRFELLSYNMVTPYHTNCEI